MSKSRCFERFYPEVRFGGFSRVDGTIAFHSRVSELIQKDDVVLDVGCGRLDVTRAQDPVALRRKLVDKRPQCRYVIGVDIDQACENNPFIDEFRLLVSGKQWPVADESVDCIVTDWVLEHVDDPDFFFSEAGRVLKPGGYLCVRTPNKWHYIPIIARLLPMRYHDRVIEASQPDRERHYPVCYRCNTRRRLSYYSRLHGFDFEVISHASEPSYLSRWPLAYRLGVWYERFAPPCLRVSLFLYARKLPV